MKFAVIENEFGEVPIDNDLVKMKSEAVEEIVNLDNGCLCCTVRGDLAKGIRNILAKVISEKKHLDGLIIETTGMADPGPVIQTFYVEQDLQYRCKIDGVITVVDAKHVMRHLLDKDRSEGSVNETQQQVAFADRILLNKIDLVTKEELEDVRDNLRQ